MAAAFQGSLFDDDFEPVPTPAPISAPAAPNPGAPETVAEPVMATESVSVLEPAAEAMPEVAVAPEVSAVPAVVSVPAVISVLDVVSVPSPHLAFADEIPLPDEPPPPDTFDFSPDSDLPASRALPPAVPAAPKSSPPAPAAAAAPVIAAPAGPPLLPDPVLATAEDKAARLAEVRAQSLTCPRCDLARTRTNVVFGEGNPNAPLVFVGEGPGENEDATGRPFVGRAGKLLDEVLRRNGMTRDHVYICNVIKCRAADPVAGRLQNRPPTPEEISACQPWLEEQMRTIKPLVIVCVGGPAANTIIHKGFRITSERGKWFDNTGYAPWAMAVFHPAYILRLDGPSYGAALETLVEDIGKARLKVIEVKRQLKEAAAVAPPPRSLFD